MSIIYILIISFIFNRKEFTILNIKKSLVRSMVTTSVIYLILCGATVFSTALSFSQIPQQITQILANLTAPSWVIMICILVLILVFGTFLESVPILYISIPILFPTAISLGYDPIHFGILIVICLMLGQITPPIGSSLFEISGNFDEKLEVVIKGTIPCIIALLVEIIILLYVSWLSTALT
ncbi:TRAP transporter large permease subunit [Ammoniphilus sp. 3BR4]|uniref:TRAP transporter large permease subunit n=1 Tax=Ammoniphilus sp. 3BR4 TaxID=3158265 RepID=UPI003467E5CF